MQMEPSYPPAFRAAILTACVLTTHLACAQGKTSILDLANQYVELRVEYEPTLAEAVGALEPKSMHLPERSSAALSRLAFQEDALLATLDRESATFSSDPQYSVLREEIESRRDLRVCRRELWSISQTEGWQVTLPPIAITEAVRSAADRRRVLELWNTFPRYINTEMKNLKKGLAEGYSAPRAVVERVVKQVDALSDTTIERSPFYSPALRAKDRAFTMALRSLIETQMIPAMREYSTFLRNVYLPQARDSLGLRALPNGQACYRAYLRRYTTADETPAVIFSKGKMLVAKSSAEIRAIGTRRYGTDDLATIIQRSHDDAANRFTSAQDLFAVSQAMVKRAIRMSNSLFVNLPSQTVVVKPLPPYQSGTGVTSHYEPNSIASEPAIFWISMDDWKSETRGSAEITAVHETVPGHHLQIATARSLHPTNPLGMLVFNAAYSEGWAHYAEQLSEEEEIDGDDYERIQRRVLAGRSLVIDVGIHANGWTREEAEAYVMQTGMAKNQADDVIDRVAVEPGQLTSYEVGGLEILALREEARQQLSERFSLVAFHQRVLEQGVVPLTALRSHVEAWIAAIRR